VKAANATVIIITHWIGILAATNKLALLQGGSSWPSATARRSSRGM